MRERARVRARERERKRERESDREREREREICGKTSHALSNATSGSSRAINKRLPLKRPTTKDEREQLAARLCPDDPLLSPRLALRASELFPPP